MLNFVPPLDANLRAKKCPNTFFKVLERQNMQNQIMPELYTDHKRSKYSSNRNDILKSAKKLYAKIYT